MYVYVTHNNIKNIHYFTYIQTNQGPLVWENFSAVVASHRRSIGNAPPGYYMRAHGVSSARRVDHPCQIIRRYLSHARVREVGRAVLFTWSISQQPLWKSGRPSVTITSTCWCRVRRRRQVRPAHAGLSRWIIMRHTITNYGDSPRHVGVIVGSGHLDMSRNWITTTGVVRR